MEQKIYIVEGRQFRTISDYQAALRDKALIERLRKEVQGLDAGGLKRLRTQLRAGKYPFQTLLGEDFADELEGLIAGQNQNGAKKGKKSPSSKRKISSKGKISSKKGKVTVTDADVLAELKRQEKKRKLLIFGCSILAVSCLGYFGLYEWFAYKTRASYSELSELKEKPVSNSAGDEGGTVTVTLDAKSPPKEVLEEFKNLLNKNKKLIGWLKIDDTNIDYPVMQTSDNEYYLDHNLNQEYDKNGSIFMDKDCDVLKPSTNLILYGHHMKNGQMFGGLDKYGSEDYFKEHRYIEFDTIYEKGTWEVMFVFRSRVYSEEEIVFKYYQFIDALSEQEFHSYMQEMANLSLYETGVTAQYGDRLLTLSTCDYKEPDGRFVVVAKKVVKE